jgi:hypothetical protein
MSKSLRSSLAQNAKKLGGLTPAKADPFDTNEKKIKELRNQRRDKLAVARYDFIDALFEEYDVVVKQSKIDVQVMGLISAARAEIVKELEATQKINQTLLGVNEKLNGHLNQAILQRDAAQRENSTMPSGGPSSSEILQAELEPLPEGK